MSKRETVEEYLKRGGTITKVPPQASPEEGNTAIPTTGSGGGLMTLAEGSIFYAEKKAPQVRKKKKTLPKINVNALPAALRRFVKDVDNARLLPDVLDNTRDSE